MQKALCDTLSVYCDLVIDKVTIYRQGVHKATAPTISLDHSLHYQRFCS